MAKYSYILSDFPNNKYNLDTLNDEIVFSSISSTLDHEDGYETSIDIYFLTDLSTEEISTLDIIVANHQGEPAEDANDVRIKGALFIKPVDVSVGVPSSDISITAIDASGQIVASDVPPIYYGQEFQWAASLEEETSTSKTPQIKVTLTTTDLSQGVYKATFAWMASHSSTSSDMIFDMQLNGDTQGTRDIHREPKDPANVYSYYRLFYFTLSGVNDISLRYWNENNSTTISDATIELIRVK